MNHTVQNPIETCQSNIWPSPSNPPSQDSIGIENQGSIGLVDSSGTQPIVGGDGSGTQPTVGGEGSESQATVGGESDGTSTKRTKHKTAPCWKQFKMVEDPKFTDGKPRAECLQCGKIFMADSAKNGTSNLNKHIAKCPKNDNKDIGQTFVQQSGGKLALSNQKIDPEVVRDLALGMIVQHELPLRLVEYAGFRKFATYLYPDYRHISRNTLLNDILKAYNKERKLIKDELRVSAGRVSVTTDLWTSVSNDGYMTLTAHYIDKSWLLHKKLIKFSLLLPPHTGSYIADAMRKFLNDWGLDEKLFSVTVDNASANNACITFLRHSLNAKKALVCKGEFFHIRCCAHILNLIVQDGLKLIEPAIQKVRDSVKFVKSSQARKVKFKECCERSAVPTSRGLHGDVSTRWNSTYQMLEDALYYRRSFEDYEDLEPNYKICPSPEEWEKISILSQLLMPFDDITKVLSGSSYPTSNRYFPCVVEIQQTLNDGYFVELGGGFLEDMLRAMREKFNKYWEQYSLILSIAVVLDPQFKFTIVEFAYNKIHGGNESLVKKSVDEVKMAMTRLFSEYKSMRKEPDSSSSATDDSSLKRRRFARDFHDFKRKTVLSSTGTKSELDLYLDEPTKPEVEDFDILSYWKVTEAQYPDLARMAKDVLAIPVSTVASESTFSAGGRVIDKYRSRLLPTNVEAMMCLRDWMTDVDFGGTPDPYVDDEELKAALADVLSSDSPSVPIEVSDVLNPNP